MEWLLGISVVLNIGLLIIISILVYCLMSAENESHHYHQEWTRWEQRWYEAQALVSSELGYHISPSGMRTEIKLVKKKGG